MKNETEKVKELWDEIIEAVYDEFDGDTKESLRKSVFGNVSQEQLIENQSPMLSHLVFKLKKIKKKHGIDTK